MEVCLIIAFCVCFCSNLLHAQDRVDFVDEFSSNAKGWMEANNSDHEFGVRDGEYQLKKKKGAGTYMVWQKVVMDDKRDWTIEATVKLVDGDDTRGYGLLFGTANSDSNYAFVLSGNGSAAVYARAGSWFQFLLPWRSTAANRKIGQWNTLKIVREYDVLAFFVNGTCVGSLTASTYPKRGDYVGFVVENVMKVAIDRIEVKSSPANRQPQDVGDGGIAIERINLGPKVNTSVEEIAPIPSADGRTIYFVRRLHSQNTGSDLADDIWYSTKDSTNSWSEAKNMGKPLNNTGNNNVISVAPDHNTLIIQNTYTSSGEPAGGGLSISHRTQTGWEIPKTIRLDSGYNLNQYSEYCLSPDGKVLIASIEQHDTKGSKDLYAFFRLTDTTFSKPKHITELSTLGSDMAPFVASDSKTMYFSSNGRAGYGGEDIFVTRRLDSTWLHWSEPMNLGNKINSEWFDAYFRTTARGDSAYMITSSNSLGGTDIVRLSVPMGARPQTVSLISGHVYDAKTKLPLAATVKYEDLSTNQEVGIARSNPKDGAYSIALPAGQLYGFRAEQEGYYPVSEQLDTRSLKAYEELNKDLYLIPIEVDARIRLNNLFFDVAKSVLRPESANELDRLIDFLVSHPAIHITIEGHTDNAGDDKSNMLLSQNRALAVQKYLSNKGVQVSRMNSKGFGKTVPVEPNTTEQGRQKNRRVEFVITKK